MILRGRPILFREQTRNRSKPVSTIFIDKRKMKLMGKKENEKKSQEVM